MRKQVAQDDIIYFVVTDRFFGKSKETVAQSDTRIHGGTLDGIIEKLDYLLELGVTTIWVTPVYENIQNSGTSEPYHYYWPQNFERIDRRLLDGTNLPTSPDIATFGAFGDMCKAMGMKVVLDMVVNHAGYGAKDRFGSDWFNVGGAGEVKGELSLSKCEKPSFFAPRPFS
jgi:glycosidase